MAGPIPFTRASSASNEPNAPCASRSATMRAASAGPIRGSVSSSAADARSISTGPAGGPGGGATTGAATGSSARVTPRPALAPFERRAGGRFTRASVRPAAAESTAYRCASSAAAAAAGGLTPCRAARKSRTVPPARTTAPRNRSAVRSALVGTRDDTICSQQNHHRNGESVIFSTHNRGP
jgi:hypothetical protein